MKKLLTIIFLFLFWVFITSLALSNPNVGKLGIYTGVGTGMGSSGINTGLQSDAEGAAGNNFIFEDGNNFIFEDGNNFIFE